MENNLYFINDDYVQCWNPYRSIPAFWNKIESLIK